MNINNNNNKLISARMEEQAASWLVRLRSDSVSDSDHEQFALWLAASEHHRAAMDAVLELWEELGVTRYMPEAEADTVTVIGQPASRPRWLAAAAMAACFLFALVLMPQWAAIDVEPATYATQMGEREIIELDDGSRVSLNTNSRIQVRYSAGQRHVTLERGEVFFEVDHNPARPFIVDTGAAEVRVLGTAFNIHRDADSSHISVSSGVVRVTEMGNTGSRAPAVELLYANQSVAADRFGLRRPAKVEAEVATAWRSGTIIADAMPLGDLVAELARYHGNRIIVTDAELALTTVSGVFPIDQPDVILKALEHSIGVQGVELEDASILLIKSPL